MQIIEQKLYEIISKKPQQHQQLKTQMFLAFLDVS
jgi:hypothetical protein